MFDFHDMYFEQRIIFGKLIFARMADEIMLLKSIKELVVIRLSDDVVEILTLLHP